jgi:DNA-binding NarL/FixJ family response regulator
MKVLLVEDDCDYREMFGIMLRNQVEIVYATNLAESFEILAKEKFDCVVVDIGLPDSEPIETPQRIMDHSPDANMVVISGNTNPAAIAAAVKAGVHGYLIKGKNDLRKEDILQAIRDAMVVKCNAT